MNQEFKYDVAISFCMEDAIIARQLNEKIKDRLSTFIFFDRQNEIAARDGEEKFSSVFGKEARIVVILYRTTWGTTPFTRIEMTAIKNRAFDGGYGFTVLIPTEAKVPIPNWYPKSFIYVGLSNYGIDGASAVIESKVTEHGGEVKEETLEIKADRLRKRLEFKGMRERVLQGEQAARESDGVFEVLCQKLDSLLTRINTVSPMFKHEKETNRNAQIFFLRDYSVRITWSRHYTNSLSDSGLDVQFFQGRDSFKDRFYFMGSPPAIVETSQYDMDINEDEEYGWSPKRSSAKFISNEDLSEKIVDKLLKLVSKV